MKSASALQRLKESRKASREQQTPNNHQAAWRSDAANEAYLQELDDAFKQLSTHTEAGSSGQLRPHAGISSPGTLPTAAQDCKIGAAHHRSWRDEDGCSHAANPSAPMSAPVGHASIAPGWRTGPVDEAGVLAKVSDRPLLCSASMPDGSNDVVVGSSDHALYVVDTKTGRKKRTLYSKSTGHTEWVTSVCCLPGGRVLSGGMDGRLWLWPAAGAAGCEVNSAHGAPVSKVAALPVHHSTTLQPAQQDPLLLAGCRPAQARSNSGSSRTQRGNRTGGLVSAGAAGQRAVAVSCSYDKTVKLWEVSGRTAKQLAVLTGHLGPVLELAVAPTRDQLLTGDRKGAIMCWNVDTANRGWGVKDSHAGHITALAWQHDKQQGHNSSADVALSGGLDGCLRVWDGRSGGCIAQQPLHVDARGKGAIGAIVTVAVGGRSLIVTAGADQTLKVVDPAASYQPLATILLTDFPYALAAAGGGLVVCGCGDGSVHIVDVLQGKTLYALGAGTAAVRAIETGPNSLVCSGDDGCVVAYQFV